jgi:hypothetical protein
MSGEKVGVWYKMHPTEVIDSGIEFTSVKINQAAWTIEIEPAAE